MWNSKSTGPCVSPISRPGRRSSLSSPGWNEPGMLLLLAGLLVTVNPHDAVVPAVAGDVDEMRVQIGIVKATRTGTNLLGHCERLLGPRIRRRVVDVHAAAVSSRLDIAVGWGHLP